MRDGEPCPGPITVIVSAGEAVPEDALACPYCGSVHVLQIVEEIIEPSVGAAHSPFRPGGCQEKGLATT
jgi:hypothetical protein